MKLNTKRATEFAGIGVFCLEIHLPVSCSGKGSMGYGLRTVPGQQNVPPMPASSVSTRYENAYIKFCTNSGIFEGRNLWRS